MQGVLPACPEAVGSPGGTAPGDSRPMYSAAGGVSGPIAVPCRGATTMLAGMTYSTAEARHTLLDTVAEAADDLALGARRTSERPTSCWTSSTADRLEAELFRPAQIAYGRAQSAHAEFAKRHGIAPAVPSDRRRRGSSRPAREARSTAPSTRSASADARLADLQDSMLPVEVGDPPLRGALPRCAR